MRTITLQEVLDYVADLSPDHPFFDGGYAESCPVAKYGMDVLGYEDAAFNGTYLREGSNFVARAEEELIKYVYEKEDELNVFPVRNGEMNRSITAEDFLRKD